MKIPWPFLIFRAGFSIFFIANQLLCVQIPALAQPEPESVQAPLPSFKQLQLPEDLGTVERSFSGRSSAGIVIIKDAHAVSGAQYSIAKILRHLEIRHGLDWVGAEGAAGPFQTELFKAFPDPSALDKALDQLTSRGEFSGAALAALSSLTPVSFEGLEDAALYQEQLDAYFSAVSRRPEFEGSIKDLRIQLNAAKARFYSPAAKDWDAKLIALQNAKNDARALIDTLKEMSRILPGFSKSYPHLSAAWNELQRNEAASTDTKLFLRGWKRTIEERCPVSKRDPAWNSQNQRWMTGALTDPAYAAYLENYSRGPGLEVPEAARQLVLTGRLLARTRAHAWVREWKKAVRETGRLIFRSGAEADIAAISARIDQWIDCIRLDLSPEDRDELRSAPRLLSKASSSSTAIPLNPPLRKGEKNLVRTLTERFEEARDALERADCSRFYEIAEKRDAVFIRKIEAAFKSGKKRAAIVAGGFHADSLARILEKKGVSFAVVTPAIDRIDAAGIYDRLMRGDVSWKKFFKIENGRVRLYESFAAAMIHQLLDLEKNRTAPRRELPLFKAWRENLIRRSMDPARASDTIPALDLLDSEVLEAYYGAEFLKLRQNTSVQIEPAIASQDIRSVFKTAANLMANPCVTVPLAAGIGLPAVPRSPAKESGIRSESRYDPFGSNLIAESLWEIKSFGPQKSGSLPTPADRLSFWINSLRKHDRAYQAVKEIASWDLAKIERLGFLPDDRRGLMTFVLMVSPDLFLKHGDGIRKWHEEFYGKLLAFFERNQEFFVNRTTPAMLHTPGPRAIILTRRSASGKILVMPVVFLTTLRDLDLFEGLVITSDLKLQVLLPDLAGQLLEHGLSQPGMSYSVEDGFYGYNYGTFFSEKEYAHRLLVPAAPTPPEEPSRPVNDHVQALILTPNEPATLLHRLKITPDPAAAELLSEAIYRLKSSTEPDWFYNNRIANLVATDVQSIQRNFGKNGMKDLMTFIFMTASLDVFLRTQHWAPAHCEILMRIRRERAKFFDSGSFPTIWESTRPGTVILARKAPDGEILAVPVAFSLPGDQSKARERPGIRNIPYDLLGILHREQFVPRELGTAAEPQRILEETTLEDLRLEAIPGTFHGLVLTPDKLTVLNAITTEEINGFDLLKQWINNPREGPGTPVFNSMLKAIAELNVDEIEHRLHHEPAFSGKEAKIDLMTFIFMTAHRDIFNLTWWWHNDHFKHLTEFQSRHARFFEDGALPVMVRTSEPGVILLVRKAKNGDLLMVPVVFSYDPDSITSGEGKTMIREVPFERLGIPETASFNAVEYHGSATTVIPETHTLESMEIRFYVDMHDNGSHKDMKAYVLTPIARSETRKNTQEIKRPETIIHGKEDRIPEIVFVRRVRPTGTFLGTPNKTARMENGRIVPHPKGLPEEVPASLEFKRAAGGVIANGKAASALAARHPKDEIPKIVMGGNFSTAAENEEPLLLMTERMIAGVDLIARRHFTIAPNSPLHLGFIMAYDPAAEDQLLALAEKIRHLQTIHGNEKIVNHLAVLLPDAQRQEAREFINRLQSSGATVYSASEAVSVLPRLLEGGHVFVYGNGQDSWEVPARSRHLLVDSELRFTMKAMFPAALALNLATASETSVTPALLEQIIPDRFRNLFSWSRGRLTALESILQAKWLETAAQRAVASAA